MFFEVIMTWTTDLPRLLTTTKYRCGAAKLHLGRRKSFDGYMVNDNCPIYLGNGRIELKVLSSERLRPPDSYMLECSSFLRNSI